MNLQINFHHIDSTEALKGKIGEKAEKLKKYFEGDFRVVWTCEVQGHEQSSHIHLTGKNLDLNAQASDEDLYKTFDVAIAKIEKQLAKHKTQVKDKIHRH